jgi:virginiamycin B lyase
MWFTDSGNDTLGRIAMDGTLSTIDVGVAASANGITTGPDGALWFGNSYGQLLRVATGGAVTIYNPSALNGIASVTTGPEGALWLTSRYDGVISEFTLPSGPAG